MWYSKTLHLCHLIASVRHDRVFLDIEYLVTICLLVCYLLWLSLETVIFASGAIFNTIISKCLWQTICDSRRSRLYDHEYRNILIIRSKILLMALALAKRSLKLPHMLKHTSLFTTCICSPSRVDIRCVLAVFSTCIHVCCYYHVALWDILCLKRARKITSPGLVDFHVGLVDPPGY
jgi:hypothetical protein